MRMTIYVQNVIKICLNVFSSLILPRLSFAFIVNFQPSNSHSPNCCLENGLTMDKSLYTNFSYPEFHCFPLKQTLTSPSIKYIKSYACQLTKCLETGCICCVYIKTTEPAMPRLRNPHHDLQNVHKPVT